MISFSLSDGSALCALYSLTSHNQAHKERGQLSVVRMPTLHRPYTFWAELLHLPSIIWKDRWVGFLLFELEPWTFEDPVGQSIF